MRKKTNPVKKNKYRTTVMYDRESPADVAAVMKSRARCPASVRKAHVRVFAMRSAPRAVAAATASHVTKRRTNGTRSRLPDGGTAWGSMQSSGGKGGELGACVAVGAEPTRTARIN